MNCSIRVLCPASVCSIRVIEKSTVCMDYTYFFIVQIPLLTIVQIINISLYLLCNYVAFLWPHGAMNLHSFFFATWLERNACLLRFLKKLFIYFSLQFCLAFHFDATGYTVCFPYQLSLGIWKAMSGFTVSSGYTNAI